MSIEQIPQQQFYKMFDADEILKCGSFTPDVDCEIKYLMHYFFIHGNIAGTEKFRSIIYSSQNVGKPNYAGVVATSEWSDFADIEDRGEYWQGWIRATFDREHLKAGTEYWLAIEIDNYTPNGMTYYIAAKFDYDNSVYPKGSTSFTEYPIATRYYPYKEHEV